MKTSEAVPALLKHLADVGVAVDSPRSGDASRALSAMQHFAAIPVDDVDVEGDGDLILAQYGTYRWNGAEYFEVDLVRQFILLPEGDDDEEQEDRMRQLHCTLRFTPTESLRALGSFEQWMLDRSDSEYWEFLSAMPAFAVQSAPVSIEVTYEEV